MGVDPDEDEPLLLNGDQVRWSGKGVEKVELTRDTLRTPKA